MSTLSHQDEVVARGFFAENRDAFDEWVTHKDAATNHFAGVAEAAAAFVALCGALKIKSARLRLASWSHQSQVIAGSVF
jgi:hypothetical protein